MPELAFQLNRELLLEWGVRLAVLLTCLPVHELAHGYMAYRLGDDTAARQGRLTLNPFAHLDLFGSLFLLFSGLFGWAKPVPVRMSAFRRPRRDMALVSAAGPLANILLAFVVMCVIKIIAYSFSIPYAPPFELARDILLTMLIINLRLAVFNLLPVPPLDGSRLLGLVLPPRLYYGVMRYERYGMIVLILLIYTQTLNGILFGLTRYLLAFLDFLTTPIDLLLGG